MITATGKSFPDSVALYYHLATDIPAIVANRLLKNLLIRLLPAADILALPFTYLAALFLKLIRNTGVQNLPLCRSALLRVGVFPLRNHYYEPQFDHRDRRIEDSTDRTLTGIDWNDIEQQEFLKRLVFAAELDEIPQYQTSKIEFHFNNGGFESGDAEYWYQLIRAMKPKRIIEIGSGYSTLMAAKATHEKP